MYVCDTAVGTLSESDKFPADWLMKYRWSKGKKETPKLPNGSKITFLKVGGRTSAIVPSVQKKTAAVAGDVSEGSEEQGEDDVKPKKAAKRKSKPKPKDEDESDLVEEEEDEEVKPKKAAKRKSKPKYKPQEEDEDDSVKEEEDEEMPVAKKQKKATNGTVRNGKKADEDVKSEDVGGRRRSGRLSKA